MKNKKNLLQKKWVLSVLILTITSFFVWLIFLYQSESKEISDYKSSLIQWKGEDVKLINSKEFIDKVEEQNYISVISSLNSIWIKNVKISKNKAMRKLFLWPDEKFNFYSDPIYEKNLIELNLIKMFNLNKDQLKWVIEDPKNKYPIFSTFSLTDVFFFNLLENKDNFFIVWMENPNNKKGKKNSLLIKSNIITKFYENINVLQNVITNDLDYDRFIKFLDNEDYIKENVKFLFIYKINKNNLKKFKSDEKERYSELNKTLSRLMLKSFNTQIFSKIKPKEKVINEKKDSKGIKIEKAKFEKTKNKINKDKG